MAAMAPRATATTSAQQSRDTTGRRAWAHRTASARFELRASEHCGAVHLAEGVGDQLEALAVGPGEVERRAAHLLARHARGFELRLEVVPARLLDRDREVMQATEYLAVRAEVEPGEV